MTIRTVIVDDEPLARERIGALLAGESDFTVEGEAGDGPEAVRVIEGLRPDLVFLDVQMPGCNGFDVIAALDPDRAPFVVFVTAYDEYALRAFDVHALDYLLKPFDRERFGKTIHRARDHFRAGGGFSSRLVSLMESVRDAPRRVDRLVVKDGGRVFFLRTSDIDRIQAAGNYVSVHMGAKNHLIRDTMGKMEERLDPATFIRIHRSTIVHIDRIRELQPDFNGDYAVLLEDGTRLSLGRSYRDRVQARLGRFHG